MVTEKEKGICTGCTACLDACPSKCITMKYDEQGFLYPCIDYARCTGCGVCDRVCEQASVEADIDSVQFGYGAFAKDKELQLSSSSGGVFSLLCNEIISGGGAVVGVAMSEDQKTASHRVARNKDDLPFFRGAKYLQSNVGDSLQKVRELLKDGTKVLFSGTPCQVSGLKACVKDDKNLLCVDMVCHGVPSPMIWKKYCEEVEEQYRGTVLSVCFRHKKYSWEKMQRQHLKGCLQVFRSKTDDPYLRLFLNDYILRPSCYDCKHKGVNRKADITLADFWGVDKVTPGFSNGAGTSLVIIHTEKGREYYEKIQDYIMMREVDPDKAYEYNGSAVKSAHKPGKLDAFWQEQKSSTIRKLADRYAPVHHPVKSILKHTPVYGIVKKNKKVNMENGILFVINTKSG